MARRALEPIEVRLEIVNVPGDEAGGVEDAMAAMDHVIVERDHHQGRIGDDAAKLAGVEGSVFDRLTRAQRAQGGKRLIGVEQGNRAGRDGHAGDCTTARQPPRPRIYRCCSLSPPFVVRTRTGAPPDPSVVVMPCRGDNSPDRVRG